MIILYNKGLYYSKNEKMYIIEKKMVRIGMQCTERERKSYKLYYYITEYTY